MPHDHFPGLTSVKRSIRIIEVIVLIVIAVATVIASMKEIWSMIDRLDVTLGDLLLMFLYLEVLAMVAIYLDSGKLPIRFPMYIAIIALARYLILEMKNLTEWEMIMVALTMLTVAAAVIVLRYGHLKLPYDDRQRLEENLRKLPEKKQDKLHSSTTE